MRFTEMTLQSDPIVSVVMSVFNGERFLREAIDSILSQTFRDFEFIVINDGSTDGTASILESYAKSDARVRVYYQESKGLIESLNRGCSLAQGKYIARMDADDIAVKDRLMCQVTFMEEHPEVGVLGGAVEYVDATGKLLLTSYLPSEDSDIRSVLLCDVPFAHPTVLIRKEIFRSVGGYRRAFQDAEDFDLWLRIAERCKLANLKAVVLKYRIHPEQVSCRKLRQQVLSVLAARAVASSKKDGSTNSLSSINQVTATVLAELGVSETTQQRALFAAYQSWVNRMSEAHQDSAALSLAMEMLRSSRWQHIERRAIADSWLRAARLYWGQGRFFQGLLSTGHAVVTRPAVAGRPVKRLLLWLGTAFRAGRGPHVAGTA
jgi:hypothetical protein